MLRQFLVTLALIVLSSTACSHHAGVRDGEQGSPDETENMQRIEEQWGIEIIAVRLSAEGYMLDFRFRVRDVEKALPLFDRKTKPYLIDQASGTEMNVPTSSKLGPLRQMPKNPVPGKSYFILFANAGKTLKTGDKVTLVIGDMRVEGLVVR